MAIHQKRIEAMTSELHRKPLQDWGSIQWAAIARCPHLSMRDSELISAA